MGVMSFFCFLDWHSMLSMLLEPDKVTHTHQKYAHNITSKTFLEEKPLAPPIHTKLNTTTNM
jgi:hypothetical protein